MCLLCSVFCVVLLLLRFVILVVFLFSSLFVVFRVCLCFVLFVCLFVCLFVLCVSVECYVLCCLFFVFFIFSVAIFGSSQVFDSLGMCTQLALASRLLSPRWATTMPLDAPPGLVSQACPNAACKHPVSAKDHKGT